MRFWQVICAGAAVSAIIELTQFVTCLGMLELDDWLLNTMGTSLGYLLCRKLFPQTPWAQRWGSLLYRKLFPRDARECESN